MTQPTLFHQTTAATVALDYTSAYFEPPDVDQAHAEWNANCGPCAFAALLGLTLADTRQHFPAGGARVNPTQMQAALQSAGRPFNIAPGWAEAKLALVQITGPWTEPGANPRWAYTHTHWIAVRGLGWIYDVNVGFWIAERDWARHMALELVRVTPRAVGWNCRLSLAVELEKRS